MGLCKCPRKKVTNLFCFEHRVNVCEHCIVENHSKCIVQSYLAWLQDSDYDPNCALCRHPLADDQTESVRLLCLHVFHWHCLDSWARQYPANTAPAGYTCPTCRECIFPKPNQESPLVNSLKHTLGRANWARAGLGLPLIPEADVGRPSSGAIHGSPLSNGNQNEEHYRAASPSTIVPMAGDDGHYSTTARKSFPSNTCGDEYDHALMTSAIGGGTSGSRYADTDHRRVPSDADNDENKYKRRSAFEWFRRWLSSNTVPVPKRRNIGGHWSCKRIAFYTFLIVVAVLTLVTVMGRMARSSTETDPFLDPMANPNIRVADVPENS